MSTQSREKQALGVFALLIVLSLAGLGWYLVAGHSWNVAASSIDEKVGQMDGYTAIVYAGTVLPEPVAATSEATVSGGSASRDAASDEKTSSSSSLLGKSNSGSAASSTRNSNASTAAGETRTDAAYGLTSDVSSVAAPVLDETAGGSSRGESAAAHDAEGASGASAGSSAGKPASSSEDSAAVGAADPSATSEDPDSDIDPAFSQPSLLAADAVQEADPSVSGASDGDSSSDEISDREAGRTALTSRKADPVMPAAVQETYLDKGAQVLCLDTLHPSIYEDGMIVKRGSKRIGVFSVDVPLSEEAAAERVDYFKDAKVDIVVCISSVRSYVRNAAGIDIVITLQDDEVSTMGTNANGTFYVNAPELETVGAILVSPSNVVSAKVVQSQ